jgi:hypothetical protein
MQIPLANCMMHTSVVLALIIRKILLSWMPVKCIHLLRTLVTNPEKNASPSNKSVAVYPCCL